MTPRTNSGAWILAPLFLLLPLLGSAPGKAAEAGDRYQCLNGPPQTAVGECLSLLRLYPQDSALHIALGQALENMGRQQEAVEVYRQGLEYVPGDPELRQYHAIALSQQEEAGYLAAKRSARASADEPSSLRLEVLRCSARSGRQAIAACDRALGLDPAQPEVLKRRGALLVDEGRDAAALGSYRQALLLEPADDDTRILIRDLESRLQTQSRITERPSTASVREAQRLLTDRGYAPGPADGQPGAKTRAAVRAFQSDHGLEADGRIDEALLANLREDESSSARGAIPIQPVVPSGALVEARLQLLRNLLDQELIDQGEFDRQQDALMAARR